MPTGKRKPPGYKPDDDGTEGPRKEQGHAVQVHEAYLEERVAGGAPPDPAMYARAAEQLRRLPGAHRAVPPPVVPEEPGYPSDTADDELPQEE